MKEEADVRNQAWPIEHGPSGALPHRQFSLHKGPPYLTGLTANPTRAQTLHYFTYLELPGRHSNLAAATSCAKHVLGYHTQGPFFLVTNCSNLPADTAAPYARQHVTNNTRPPQLPQVTRHSYHYPSSPTSLDHLPHEPSRTTFPTTIALQHCRCCAPHRSRLPLPPTPTRLNDPTTLGQISHNGFTNYGPASSN